DHEENRLAGKRSPATSAADSGSGSLEHRVFGVGPGWLDRLIATSVLGGMLDGGSVFVAPLDAVAVERGIVEDDHGAFVGDELIGDAEIGDGGGGFFGAQFADGMVKLDLLDFAESPQAFDFGEAGVGFGQVDGG